MTAREPNQLVECLALFLNLDHLTESVALAMATAEGNREAQQRAHLNNYDALGYTTLAKAAVAEMRRLGALAWPVPTTPPISVSSSAPDGGTEPTATCERDGHESGLAAGGEACRRARRAPTPTTTTGR